jgi:hypothetical protein
MKMHIDNAKSDVALKNLDALGDIELILGFLCIFLLLEIVHTVVAFPFATCLANNYFQKFFFFALTSSQLFSLLPGRFCNFSIFLFW